MAGKREYMLLNALSMFNADSPLNYLFPLNLRSNLQIIPNCHRTSFNLNYLVHAYRTINAWAPTIFYAPNQWKERTGLGLANPIAVLDTNMGVIKLELFASETPITVQNFVKLCKSGFYDGLIFHRVIDGFMIQGGCPRGDGTGGPEYTIKDEFVTNLKHSTMGTVSMANAGPNTGGSQFFITLAPTTWLDGKHTVFGKVIEGIDVVQSIGKVQTDNNDRPIEVVKIKSAKIIEL